nr:MbcA/ParS/Xre antitoxin family protein [Thioalkalivibrio sp. ALE28]
MHSTMPSRSPNERRALARMVTTLFEHWALDDDESLAMLGLTRAGRSCLTRYRKGEPLSAHRDMLDRVGHLLAIHKTLRQMFPHERDQAYRWIRTRNRAFDQRTPAEMITEHGFAGLLMVRTYLDRAATH